MGFKDFHGLPKSLKERNYQGEIDFKLPITRLRKNENKLIKHPFYNFGKRNGHI